METLKCPHCGEVIELLAQGDLSGDEYNLTPNKVAAATKKGIFPPPVLKFVNRTLWSRQDIDEYMKRRGDEKIAEVAGELEKRIEKLPALERKKILEMLMSSS